METLSSPLAGISLYLPGEDIMRKPLIFKGFQESTKRCWAGTQIRRAAEKRFPYQNGPREAFPLIAKQLHAHFELPGHAEPFLKQRDNRGFSQTGGKRKFACSFLRASC